MADGYYRTTFSGGTEDPLFEGGAWAATGGAVGLDWTDPKIDGNISLCFADEQTGFGGGNNAMAVLAGTWTPDQIVTVKVRNPTPEISALFTELHILLRAQITAHVARGYAVVLSCRLDSPTYVQVRRLDGPFEAIDVPNQVILFPHMVEGDQFRAGIVGTMITVERWNGTAWDFVMSWDTFEDAIQWSDGNPGLALSSSNGPATRAIGFYEFTAINAADTPPVDPPPDGSFSLAPAARRIGVPFTSRRAAVPVQSRLVTP